MTNFTGSIAAMALAWAALAGGASRAATPPEGGTISIEPQASDPGSGANADQVPPSAFRDAVSAALTARGFTVFADAGHAASVVELIVARSDVGLGFAKAAGEKAAVAGAGVAVPLGTGDSQQVRLRRTRLEMRIHARGSAAILWDGAAVTVREAATAKGADGVVAADLTRALLASYPAQPTEVVGVP